MGLYYEVQLSSVENNVYGRLIEYTINGEKYEKPAPFGATVLSLPPVNAGDTITVKVNDLGLDGSTIKTVDVVSFTANNSIPNGVKLLANDENVAIQPPAPAPVAPPEPEPPVVDETPVNVVSGDVVVTPTHEE